jgi:hypothetical protein
MKAKKKTVYIAVPTGIAFGLWMFLSCEPEPDEPPPRKPHVLLPTLPPWPGQSTGTDTGTDTDSDGVFVQGR